MRGGLKGNKLFRNPPASLAFKTHVAQQEMQSNYNGKCCFERCVGEMNDGGGLGCLKKDLLSFKQKNPQPNVSSLTCNFFYNVFHHNSEFRDIKHCVTIFF